MSTKSLATLCAVVVAIWAAGGGEVESANAPAPAVDCSSLFGNMVDCLTFVTNGSTLNKPEGSCCSGLKTVLKTDAECLCEAFKSSAQLGVVLNVTKASTLPSVCHLSAPPLSHCGLSIGTGAAPASSPSGAVPPSTAGGPTPEASGGNEGAAGPNGSGSPSALAISVGYLVPLLLLVSFFSLY